MGGKLTVALIGPYSVPLGGVSVHVQRLAALLSTQFRVVVIDPYRVSGDSVGQQVIACGPPGPLAVIRSALIARKQAARLVHVHVSGMVRFVYGGHLLLGLLPAAACRVLTIHSGSFVPDYHAANPFFRMLIRSLVKKFDLVIAVSAEIEAQLRSCGVSSRNITVLPAFIPPDASEISEGDDHVVPPSFRNGKILVASGYGTREYGFEVLLNALSRSDWLRSNSSVVLCLYNTYEEKYVHEIERLAAQLPRVKICRDLSPAQFSRVLSAADIYVRPTTRDGDAVGVREAGHYGKQIIASDCVRRPAGCQLFRTGDAQALSEGLSLLVNDNAAGRLVSDHGAPARYGELYRRCIDLAQMNVAGPQDGKS